MEQFFSTLSSYLFPDAPLILTGDFNMVEDPLLDRKGPTILPQHTKDLDSLTELKRQYHVVDCWRLNNPTQRQYTWPTKSRDVQSHLDRIYQPVELNRQLIQQSFHPTVWSDHKYITTRLYLTKPDPRGPNYWKLNTEILTETEYRERITHIIQVHQLKLPNYPDILQWWDSLKDRIRTASIAYCKRRAHARRTEVNNIKRYIDAETSTHMPDTARVEDLYRQLQDLQRSKQ